MSPRDVKANLEIEKLKLEKYQRRLETGKFTAEIFWYPMTVAIGVVVAISGMTALVIMLFI